MSKVMRLWLLSASLVGIAASVPIEEQLLQAPKQSSSLSQDPVAGSQPKATGTTPVKGVPKGLPKFPKNPKQGKAGSAKQTAPKQTAPKQTAPKQTSPKQTVPKAPKSQTVPAAKSPASSTVAPPPVATPAVAPPPPVIPPPVAKSPTAEPTRQAQPPGWVEPLHPPGNDPWYIAPKGFEDTKVGTILKYRRVPKGISLDNKNTVKIKQAWQILYRTQSSNLIPEATVVTVLIPNNAKMNNLFMYHWFSDAVFQDCNPSLSMQVGTRSDNAFPQKQTGILIAALAQGWVTVVPDDGGQRGIFANGRHEAYAILDSIRALKQSGGFTGIGADPTITLYGYSGGAIAGTWATEMQAEYAPELKIAGGAFGGLLPNTTYLFQTMTKNLYRASYAYPVMVGQAKDYKNYTDWINDNLIPEKAADFRKVYSQCYDANWDFFTNKTLGTFFKGGDESLISEIPKSVQYWAGTGGTTGTPITPWYIYETVGDDASPVEIADALIDQHCKAGADVLYERNPKIVSHSQEMVDGLPGAFRWLMDRQEGKPITKGCLTYEKTPESELANKQGIMMTGLLANAIAYLGVPIGPNSWTAWLAQFPNRMTGKLDI